MRAKGCFTALAASAAVLCLSAFCAEASAAPAAPSGPHPRIYLTGAARTALDAKRADANSHTSRTIKVCDDVIANPSKWSKSPSFEWGAGATACGFAWQFTQKPEHAAAGIKMLNALLDDLNTVGDAQGGDDVVTHDSGYYIRLYGPYAGLAFDWLQGAPGMDATLKAKAIARFKAWITWYMASGYLNDEPGSNYHAGYVFAKVLIAIAMSGEDPAGATYWTDVVDNIFAKQIVGAGLAKGGVLKGGDWAEGWQYGPLSVLEYALSARALAEQGVTYPELNGWSNDLTLRFFHSLTPNRAETYVGGDFDDSGYNAKPNARSVLATLVGPSTDEAAGWAMFARKNITKTNEQISFVDALGELRTAPAVDLGGPNASKWYLAEGARRLYMRSGWETTANWATFVSSPHNIPDHSHADASSFVLYRGADALIVDPTPYGSFSTLSSNAFTVESESVGAEYKPSHNYFASKADMPWARAGESGIIAARADLAQAFRGNKNANTDVPYAHREFTFLPEGDVVLIDRARTDNAARGLRVRFHSPQKFTLAGAGAKVDVGGSTLRVFGVEIGGQTPTERMSPQGDCYQGTRGSCENARFPSGEYNVRVPGPDARAVHVLSSFAKGTPEPQALSINDPVIDPAKNPTVLGAVVTRGTVRTVVVGASAKDGAAGASLSYLVPAGGSRNVVFDAPEAADGASAVTATAEGQLCKVTITPAQGAGFAGRPLMFTVGTQADPCAIAEDKVAPPGAAPLGPPGGAIGGPGGPGGPGGANGANGGAAGGAGDDGGCGCSEAGRPVQNAGFAALFVAGIALLTRRRKRD